MVVLSDLQHLATIVKQNFDQNFVEKDCTLPEEFKNQVRNINSFSLQYDKHTVVFSGGLTSYIPNQLFYVAVFFSDYTNELFKYKREVISILSNAGIRGQRALNQFFVEERADGKGNIEQGVDRFVQILDQQEVPEPNRTYLIKFVTDYNWWNAAKTIERDDFYYSSVLSTIGVTASSNTTLGMICGYLAEHPDHLALLKNHDRFADNDNTDRAMITSNDGRYDDYIDLLTTNFNLVLTGAPGTGKTWLAQEIANSMGAESLFVQFHPSFDYTDFVEGLRPIKSKEGSSQIGFVRKDGLFKSFCKRAIRQNNDNAINALASFKRDVKERGSIDIPYRDSDGYFKVSLRPDGGLIIETKSEEPNRQSAPDDSVIKVIETETKEENQTYPYCVGLYIKQHYFKKPFVLIIDEINRGEVSKIFGELFFSIDPGYRGKKDPRVNTQYQNLIDEDDEFKDGFYVPDNVFILATMNDIDRSVESMDFAIRRRFVWKEITPADTIEMLDKKLSSECSKKAKAVMNKLNSRISSIDYLGKAYEVGPAYFLKLKTLNGDFDKLWTLSLEPLIREYLRGYKKADELLLSIKTEYFGAVLSSPEVPTDAPAEPPTETPTIVDET